VDKSNGLRIVSGASLVIAVLQSICTAVLTISGIRLAIGLTAFVMASSLVGPVRWFHQDAIRIPMLLIATIGAIVDLGVLWWMQRLRTQTAAKWRRRKLNSKEKRSNRLQIALAVLTLVLVGTEMWTHAILHRPRTHTYSPQATATFTPETSKHI
jgi:hypothetical protein